MASQSNIVKCDSCETLCHTEKKSEGPGSGEDSRFLCDACWIERLKEKLLCR